MLAFDVFTNDAFSLVEINEAIGNITYIPGGLNRMGLFEPEPISTTNFGIYKKDERLELIKTSERGTQPQLLDRDLRNLKQFPTLRLAQEDRIKSHELQNIINDNMPFELALARADAEVAKRQKKMMRQLELTREFHRLAAIQGFVMDADGSVLFNMFTEFGFIQPAAILFNFATLLDGLFREKLAQQVLRPMARQAAGRWVEGVSKVGALCGDAFYDTLVRSAEVRETYKTDMEFKTLREARIWDAFHYGGVDWMNYRGTNDNSTIKVADNEVKFFPIDCLDTFKEVRAPGEDFASLNSEGQEFYSYVSPDYRPNMMQWVDVYLFAYPLIFCQSPDLLLRGQLQ